MKRWPYLLILLIVVVWGVYYLFNSGRLPLPSFSSSSISLSSLRGDKGGQPGASEGDLRPAQASWRMVNRPADGFRIEMPSSTRDLEAPAQNQSGGTEPVKMLQSSPDGDTSYVVTWADNPPVARANNGNPDRTLDQARDGMLRSTETTLVNETRITVGGFPAREILAHNDAGGVLNARLVLIPAAGAAPAAAGGAGPRLYTLMALFPTAGARNEQDVSRFFNSFTITSATAPNK